MTPDQMARARKRLGLTLEQMAPMLGYDGSQGKSQVHHLETGRLAWITQRPPTSPVAIPPQPRDLNSHPPAARY